MSLMQLLAGGGNVGNGPGSWPCPPGSCIASPPIQEISQLPSGTSAPNTVITQHAITTLHLQNSIQTAGCLITCRPSSLTSIPVTNLLVILVGMPLAATVLGWLLADRDPAGHVPPEGVL